MVKYFMKVVVLFIIFSVFFITSNSSFILINNASAYEKENYGLSAKKDFDKKKYENNINEYNNLGKEKKETETLKKVDNSDVQYLENDVSSNTQKTEKKVDETYNDKKIKNNSAEYVNNEENQDRENKDLREQKVPSIGFFRSKKNEKQINKIKTYLSDKNVNKLKNLSFDKNDIKAINEILEDKFNNLEKILGKNISYPKNNNFNFSKFKNKDKNIERVNNVNEQLDYITKTLQVMRLK
ncbi:MAG: hypothetical protein ACJ0BU_05860 [Candidatus Puniceispirillales bacterium]|mgnify:FL=1